MAGNGSMGESKPLSSFDTQSVAFGQMQDVIRTQSSLIVKLKYRLEKKNDSVSKDLFEELREKLEEERRSHQITQSKLANREKELEFALKEVNLLSKQLEKEKENFDQAYKEMRKSAQMKNQENSVLLDKCTEISEVCGAQGNVLMVKDKKIRDLKEKLAKQTHQRRVVENEASLRIQQERYLTGHNYAKNDSKVRRDRY